MGVYPINWDTFVTRVFEFAGRLLECEPYVSVGHIETPSVDEECREECACIMSVAADVIVSPSQCAHRAVVGVTIMFLVNANTFPSILLIIKFECGAVCG